MVLRSCRIISTSDFARKISKKTLIMCCAVPFFFFFFFRKQLEDILNNQKEKPDVGTLLLVSFISNLLSLILLLHVFEECKLVSCYCKLEEVELTIFSYIYIFL